MKNFRLSLLILAGFFASISASQAAVGVTVTILAVPNAFHPVFAEVQGVNTFQSKFSADQQGTQPAPLVLPVGSSYPVFGTVNGVPNIQLGTMAVVDIGGGNGQLVFTPAP